jgi:SH3-like domain-containing protein
MNSKPGLVPKLTFLMLLMSLFILVVSGCSLSSGLFNRGAATPSPSPTALPPTATYRPTATITPSPTPPAVLNGVVLAAGVNLRVGPGLNYAVNDVLTYQTGVVILEKTSDDKWYHVKLTIGGKDGWLSADLISIDFEPTLIPYSKTFKPTGTPALASPATIKITNGLNQIAKITLDGPSNQIYTLQPGETQTVQIPSGDYQFVVTADGYLPLSGEQNWGLGSWSWNIGVTQK